MNWLRHEGSVLNVNTDTPVKKACQDPAYTSHYMEDARSTHRNADAWLSSEIAICRRGVGSCLFIAKADESNAEIQTLLSNISDRESRYAKDDLNTEVVQCLSNDLGTGRHDEDGTILWTANDCVKRSQRGEC